MNQNTSGRPRGRHTWRAGRSSLLISLLMGLGATFVTSASRARPLEAVTFEKQKVRVDGLLREWPADLDKLSRVLRGKGGGRDPEASGAIGYDEKNLYVAMKVRDQKLVRTKAFAESEDHAELVLSFPSDSGFRTRTVLLFAGETGKIAGQAKLKGGGKIAGAKLVEAPSPGGHLLEASIPWAAIPEAKTIRAGLRAALRYHDSDGGSPVVVATSAGEGKDLPPMLFENEQGLYRALIRKKGLGEKPAKVAVGDIAGDGAKEVVAIYGGYLTVVGGSYRGGKEFFFQDLGVDGAAAVTSLSLDDLTRDGKDEILVQKRVGDSKKYREVLQVFRVSEGGDAPYVAFQHELSIVTEDGEVENELSFDRKGKAVGITVSQGDSKGFEPGTYSEPLSGDMPGALLPWESVKSRTFRWTGKAFEEDGVATWDPPVKAPRQRGRSASADGPPAPPPPRPPSADEMLDRVYALYRSDRGAGKQKPRFDFVTDVAGGSGPERVLVHDRDIVVFGKEFKGGLSYAYITIGVENGKDIHDVSARDLTGDGKAEIVVRGTLRAKASEQLGGKVVERHAFFVYRVSEQGIKRIFAAETGRALEDASVIGGLRFVPQKRGYALELHPLRAVNWNEKNYPFPIDRHPYGGLEPLLLPWGDQEPRRYRFDGDAFVPD